MIINLINKNSARIILLFSTSPGRRYLRKEIQEKTEINNVPLDSSLAELLSFKMILKKGKIYSLNIENEIIKLILEELKETAYIPLKIKFLLNDFVFYASKVKEIESMMLFGSYAKLIFSEKSDIDIAVISEIEKKSQNKILSIADRLSKEYKKELHINFFSKPDLKHKKDALIKDILRNGRRIL